MLTSLLSLLTPELLGTILAAAIPALLTHLFKDRAAKAQANLRLGVDIAYDAVSQIAAKTATPIDDKAAEGLKFLKDYFDKQGVTLKPADAAKAVELFDAKHANETAAKALADEILARLAAGAPAAGKV